ncbi:TonB-dependent receptor [Sphingobacterium sp. Ag1]|uniref:TonB-dependent receptor n=1 Tax=Sphingobacterium sp. Ag1 TaxID=1643451 RepID=UPI000AC174A9|nr:TonB-dependent receptor [Sphingobacterium sp. Ag1]
MYKKFVPISNWLTPTLIKPIMKLKLSVVILLLSSSYVNAVVYSQQIKLSVTNGNLKEILASISKQSGYHILYLQKDVINKNLISVHLTNVSLPEALKKTLENTGLHYVMRGKQILIEKEKQNLIVTQGILEQQKQISGTVTGTDGKPIAGATIQNLQGGLTSTDEQGNFSLKAKEGDQLLIRFMSYQDQQIVVSALLKYQIKLTPKVDQLEEVVVVGYGTAKKSNLTGAVTTVDLKRQENAPLSNASQLLQGVQGVYVNQPGGQPGRDEATVRVRGQGTLNNNNPLVLVNGIEYSMDNVNPADIASITVLKDAASSAIYGARAANGVILITTKSGVAGKFEVKYDNYFGYQEANYLPDFVKDPIEFMKLRNQAQRNEGKAQVDYSDALIEEYAKGMKEDPIVYPNNDWFKIIFGKGAIQNHHVSFSGGTDKLTHSLSLNYLKQDGAVMGTSANRYGVNYNTQAQITNRLKVGGIINVSYKDLDEPTSSVANLMEMTFKAQAFHPTYLADGRYANTFIRTPGHNVYRNPLVLANEGQNNTRQQRALLNVFAEYKLPFDITYKINGAINKTDDRNSRFVPDVYVYQVKTNDAQRVPFDGASPSNRGLRKTSVGASTITLFQTLDWQKTFADDHQIKLLVGHSRESASDENFYAQNEGYLGNDLYELNAGSSNAQVGGTSFKSKLLSYFGRANYSYKEKYLFEANMRYDGSSRFAKGKQWGMFPSFSAGWRLKQESFMHDITWVNDLKLRASYGSLGNERIDLFRFVNLISLGQDYPFGSAIASGSAVLNYNDPNITWETTTMGNIGVDAQLFNNRLGFTGEIFKKRTTDILQMVTLPDQVGALGGPIQNVGTVDNTGIELGLNYQDKINGFGYQLSGSITYIKNKIVSLKGRTIYNGRTILKEGYPINSYYLIKADGIFQSEEEVKNSPFQTNNTKPGYLKYEDFNNDKFITENDRQIVGSNIPRLTYQFNINLSYKDLSLSSFFQGVGNVYTYAENIGAMPFWFGTSVPKKWVTDSWTPDNPNASLPILTTFEGSTTENFRSSSFWLRNAAYLRLKNLQLAYNLPKTWVDQVGISKLRVFVNAQNLLTISKMTDFDPEKNLNGSTFYEYPTVKTFTAGLNLTF